MCRHWQPFEKFGLSVEKIALYISSAKKIILCNIGHNNIHHVTFSFVIVALSLYSIVIISNELYLNMRFHCIISLG